jgi:polysaccharide biosynthesis transport protein
MDDRIIDPASNRREGIRKPVSDLVEADLQRILSPLWRRKWVIFWTIVLGTLATTIASFLITPVYEATAEVLVEEQKAGGIDVEAVVRGLPLDMAVLGSQIEVITSRKVVGRAVDELNLMDDPEFNPALTPPTVLNRIMNMLSPATWFGSIEGKEALSPEDKLMMERNKVVETALEMVEAEVVGNSHVIAIKVSSVNDDTAAKVANTITDEYINERLESKYSSVSRTIEWLNDRVGKLREKVQISEAAVEQFRSRAGLLEATRGETITEKQLSELNTQLILARSARAEAEARLSQVRRLISGGSTIGSTSDVIKSQLIDTLIGEEAVLKRRVAELGEQLGPRHPQMINARAELADLQRKIGEEMQRIAAGLDNEVAVAQARERSLENSISALEGDLSRSNTDAVQLRALERDAAAARTTLEAFMQRFQELAIQDDLSSQRPDASVVSYAVVPEDPAFPKKRLVIAAAIVVSGVLGVALAFAFESLDAGFRSGEQVEQQLGLPVFGLVPELGWEQARGKKTFARYIMEKPNSALGEAIRGIYTKLVLLKKGGRGHVIQVVSAEPGEGKSTLALSLARVQGMVGRRVLLIDCDFRRSPLSQSTGLARSPGLMDLMRGTASVEDVLQLDPDSSAHIIAAGQFSSLAHDLFVSGKLDAVVKPLRDMYDFIILDSPPILSVSDAGLIASSVDSSLFVIRWAKTRRAVVRHALDELTALGGYPVGCVLTRVNVRRHALYDYGDSGKFHGKYAKYYRSS